MNEFLIAQTQPQPITLPPAPPLIEGGIIAAIAVYVVKEAVSFFKTKEASDDKLTRTLIEDLRADRANELKQQSEVLRQLKQSHDKIAIAIERMSATTADINTALQISKRNETEIFHALRQNHQALILINEKIDRLTPGMMTNGKHTPRS
ncbi:hypothetical protein [Leptolyngbya sp. NIES-2104]|uniref:hypothetical protein n=1 Tax=Leptolyngbya sp. NIES-2104 TaxID=1552121 RepID=UPI0006ECBEF8|nr:hypothetical protein [Leptolyngbya sp. NIES-2104]GAP99118.1 hypothetical protein NIES2104_56760 [Leptolyngbya sp. NIES-2104]